MKKMFMFTVLLLIGLYLYSEETVKQTKEDDESFSYYLTVNQLISKNLFKNKDLISEYSQKLNNEQILLIQKKYQKDLAVPLLLNGFVGFGSGNFACGDMLGGGIHAAIDGLSVLSMLTMQFINLVDLFSTTSSDPLASIANIDRRMKIFSYVAYSAGSIMLVNRIASLITASLYVKRYNQTLNDVLIKKTPKISFTPIPILTPEGMGLALNIRF